MRARIPIRRRRSDAISDTNAILLLFDQLSSVNSGPAQIPELLDFVQSALDREPIRDKVGRRYAQEMLMYEPSDLFVKLHEMEREGLVTRETMGYIVTDKGHEYAATLRSGLPDDVKGEIELATNAV